MIYRPPIPNDAPAAHAAPDEADTPLIVLVEDHEETRYVIQAVLEQSGFRVEAASNGREGLDAIRELEPVLVITDLMMPVLDGLQLARALTDDTGTRAIPLILVSAHASDAGEDRDLEARFDAVLRKPVRPARLIEAVRDLLSSS
ncbi:MAG: response regulator [Gemmatimonadota bacterium]